MPPDPHRTVEAVWRMEAPRIHARLVRIVRDVGRAEELAQDALVAALERWPVEGVPDNPGAWLMTAATHRAIDAIRRTGRGDRVTTRIAAEADAPSAPDLAAHLDDEVGDDLLRLMFIACHPALPPDARVALTLRLLGGLTTAEIARAFLVPEPTLAQRLVRAKRTLAEAGAAFEAPRGDELLARVDAVLGVIYLVFNEGYAASAGADWLRPALCDEAMRLGRVLVALVPNEPEVHGLLTLMEIQASRARARTDATGAPILLPDQDRSRWDQRLIRRGFEGLARAFALGPAGPYTLQAAIAACHARAQRPEDTDWARIVTLYDALQALTPSPVVALNRAVAVAMAEGPAAGLAAVEALREEPALRAYHLLPSVRGDLLLRLGRRDEARAELLRAAELADNAREREMLERKAGAIG